MTSRWMQQHLPPGVTLTRRDDRALHGAAGPEGRGGAGQAGARRRGHRLHALCRRRRSAASGPRSRAPATPARTASRSRSRTPMPPKLWDAAARRPAGEARRPRRARFAAPRSRPLPLRPRPRRDHLAGRGRARLVDPEAPPQPRATSPAPRACRRNWPTARRASASASGPRAGRRRATARSSPMPAGREIGKVTSGGFGPSVNGPVAMGYVETRSRSPAPDRSHRARQADARRDRRPSLHSPPLQTLRSLSHDRQVHQGP